MGWSFKYYNPNANRTIDLLSNIRRYTLKYLLKTIYNPYFNSHQIYASPILGQSRSDQLKKLTQLQEKALTIIKFLPDGAPLQEIYQNSNKTS